MKSLRPQSGSKKSKPRAARSRKRMGDLAMDPGRILMLGWAFPPYLSGGVGTACQGLCRALTDVGVGIDFIMSGPGEGCVPDGVDALTLAGKHGSDVASSDTDRPLKSEHVQVSDSWDAAIERANLCEQERAGGKPVPQTLVAHPYLEFIRINVALDPYQRPTQGPNEWAEGLPVLGGAVSGEAVSGEAVSGRASFGNANQPAHTESLHTESLHTESLRQVDLFSEVDCYTHQAIQAAASRQFEFVHAHDWMTFQAGAAIAESSGKPFVAHVHSTEYERTANQIDGRIFEIEKSALLRADAVVAVSHMAREVLIRRYDVPDAKIAVVYNGVDCNESTPAAPPPNIVCDEKIVLFMGRMTLQKGPEYFLAAARKVLEVVSDVRFVMAGSGELLEQTMGLARQLGISDRVIFPGFLRGDEVERMFRSADLYVMPSVSDPFGIAALEAASFDVPVLVSRQSGVSEVLRHVLKTDFWDIDDMADKIVAVLRHPPLQATLRRHAGFEVRGLTWSGAARRVVDVYQLAMNRASVGRE